MPFVPGDVVRLKSGGFAMTVARRRILGLSVIGVKARSCALKASTHTSSLRQTWHLRSMCIL